MGLFTVAEADAAREKVHRYSKAASIFREDEQKIARDARFDIFLSHSYRDAVANEDRMQGIRVLLEDLGYKVYVDWIVDQELDRTNVTVGTAARLRLRMMQSRCLLFLTSTTSQESKWMPWELGYKDGQSSKDGKRGRVATIPLVTQADSSFKGQEYLGMYPYVDKATRKEDGKEVLWVNDSTDTYVEFDQWLEGKDPLKRG